MAISVEQQIFAIFSKQFPQYFTPDGEINPEQVEDGRLKNPDGLKMLHQVGGFTANNKQYHIDPYNISSSRYMLSRKYQFEAAAQHSVADIKQLCATNVSYIEKMKLNSIGFQEIQWLHTSWLNISDGLDELGKEVSPILILCTFFMNTEHENRSDWNLALAMRKIEDWKIEARTNRELNHAFFFAHAHNFIQHFTQKSNDSTLESGLAMKLQEGMMNWNQWLKPEQQQSANDGKQKDE